MFTVTVAEMELQYSLHYVMYLQREPAYSGTSGSSALSNPHTCVGGRIPGAPIPGVPIPGVPISGVPISEVSIQGFRSHGFRFQGL